MISQIVANICPVASPPCEFPAVCSLSVQSVQRCNTLKELPTAEEFRASAWYVSLTVNNFYPDDATLLAELRPYLRYRLRCAPVDSIMLAYLHHRDSRDQQKNEMAESKAQIVTPGIRSQRRKEGWVMTRYGQHYEELITDFHDVWGGGRFDEV
jgi:hypothetical protein